MPDLIELHRALSAVVVRHWGVDARASELTVFEEGHAGLTLGFSVARGGPLVGHYVLKLAPFGVARRGANDVYRQAPLLRVLNAAGLPAPGVPIAAADEADLGTPYIVMERLPGRTFVIWEPHESFSRAPESTAPFWRAAAARLAELHAYDWREQLGDWAEPTPLVDELAFWLPSLEKAVEPGWLNAGRRLAERLGERLPVSTPIGLVHGDYQPGNLLFEDGLFTGMIDWDLAGIGAQGLDLGWLLMMADPACWHADWQPFVGVEREELVAMYNQARGLSIDDTNWFEALACYRMGAIACVNVRLHRSGRRPDPLWDRFASSIDTLFARGLALV